MLDSFLTFINQQHCDLGSRKTLLAVSGGIDSVVMTHLFHKAGFMVGIAHCNFGLRGQESDDDERFVRNLADSYQIPFFARSFTPKSFAYEQGISLQMSARTLRYRWFEETRSEFGYDWIATAHHTNDSIETTLLNIARGTGLTGLHGIPAVNGNVLRPLLFSVREEIHAYAEKHHLSWREDRSNSSVDYQRNLIRHRIVPVLKELNPALERTFRTTTERLRAADVLLKDFMERWQKENVRFENGQSEISIESLRKNIEPAYGLWFILQNYGFNYQQAQAIFNAVDGTSGKIFYSRTHKVLKDRDCLIVKDVVEAEDSEMQIDDLTGHYVCNWGELSISSSDAVGLEKTMNTGRIFLDGNKLSFPLKIRGWAQGDTFHPFGMGGKRKKVSDLLVDLKYSIFQKQKVKVLLNGTNEIIWVVGIRADERFRVTPDTKTVVTMDVSNPHENA